MSSVASNERLVVDDGTPLYRAPALEKGLDVLECLAAQGTPMTQAQLARALGRGAGELFRVLTTLERRGYVARDPTSGVYALTLRLYELGHAHSPFEALRRAAERPMRALSDELRESCHLSVVHRGLLLVLHQEESPARVRISIEVGSTIALARSASGRVLLAGLDERRRAELIARDAFDGDRAALDARLALVHRRGHEEARSETVEGVSDLSVPVGGFGAGVAAALAIAALPRDHAAFVAAALPALRRCASAVASAAGLIGSPRGQGGE